MGDDRPRTVGIRAVGVGEQRPVLVGEQESRDNGVHAHFGAELHGQFGCHILRVVADGGLGGPVAHDTGQRTQRRLGAEIDDDTLFTGRHGLAEDRRRQHRAEQIEVYDLLESVDLQVEERLVGSDRRAAHIAARGIEQDVDRTVRTEDGLAVGHEHLAVEYVGDEEHRFAARGSNLPDELFARLLVAVENHDARALLREVNADRAAQDSGSARHDDDAAPDVKQIFHSFFR